MRAIILFITYLLHATYAAPQFVTFKDGKIGVNFGGYHAEAGLGGLLTGNAAHGGLSASAGTPWGPKAAAGLGGALDGRTSGLAYAGAEANPSVGASAVLHGNAGENGFIGSEAHANAKISSNSIHYANSPHVSFNNEPVTSAPGPVIPPPVHDADTDMIQKVKPPKKYSLIKSEHPLNANVNAVHSKTLVKNIHKSVTAEASGIPTFAPPNTPVEVRYNANPGLLGNALNIPIGILRVIQDSLTGISVEKSVKIGV